MRIRSALLALTLVLPAAAFSVAAHVPEGCTTYDDGETAEEPSDDIITCTEAHYLSCENTLDPAGKLHDITTVIPLVTEAPETSFTAGGGCGYPEDPIFSGTVQNTPYQMDFGGFVTSNIDTMTIELHDLGPHENVAYAALGNEVELDVRITIDGFSPFGSEENEAVDGSISKSPLTLSIPVTAELSDTGLSSSYVFTVTNIGADLPETLTEFGEDGQVFHNVLVSVEFPRRAHPAGSLPSDNIAPVWGASEVPASIVLNGEQRGTIVDALAHNAES